MRSAVVLAGGNSRRFGDREKATVELEGTPLVRHVADSIDEVVDEVVVNCRGEQHDAIAAALEGLDYRTAVDPVPGRGPVAGLRTGCRVARGPWTFVIGCDMPFVRAELVTRLFDAADRDGVVPCVDGRPQPLAAVYRTDATVTAADITLATGARSMRKLLSRLSVVTVSDPVPGRVVDDIDTRSELRAARADGGRQPPDGGVTQR